MKLKVKICGITSLEDAQFAVNAGADYVGFIFAPESTRCITPEQCADISSRIEGSIGKVGVFVNESAYEIQRTMDACGLNIAQLHGEETEASAQEIGACRVWKRITLTAAEDLQHALTFPAAAILTDSRAAGMRGGTGRTGNWALASKLAAERWVIAAGGLGPDNVLEAVRQIQPFGVDLNSGVEHAPGTKDPEKIKLAMERLRPFRA